MPGDTGRISYYQKWRPSDKHITLTQANIQLLKFVVSSQKQLEWQETSMVTSKLIRVTNLKAGTTMQGTQWICSLKYMHLFLSQFLVGWKNCWEAEVETFLLEKKNIYTFASSLKCLFCWLLCGHAWWPRWILTNGLVVCSYYTFSSINRKIKLHSFKFLVKVGSF